MTTWNKQSKNSSSFSNKTKSSSVFSTIGKTLFNQFLLQENGSFLLLETGFKTILEQSTSSGNSYTTQLKS